ncbi:MAG: AAA family ATPase [Saprospiraceae bacterium]|nr:AAA family ATPase [Saprospiraceae bacterium]
MNESGLFIPEGFDPLVTIYKDEGHEVIKAIDLKTNQEVVLKINRPENKDILKISKLSHEYNTLKKLDHDGVIKVYNLYSKLKSVCIVEEYFDGESLKSRLFKKPISLREFFHIALQLTDILAYIHSHGIIHKDINSNNILVSEANKVKLIDFGISTNFMNEEQEILLPDSIEGTLTYVSPEQTGRTSYSITPASDLYSLGIVFYEMLSGKPPFDSADALEVIHFHLSRIPASLKKIIPNIPIGLDLLVSTLLEKIPDDRYQSAAGIRHDLKILESQIESGQLTNSFKTRLQDKAGKFRKTQRLYGRETEIAQLLASYANLAHSRSMLALVAGYSGVGKSAVVKQIQRPVIEKNGLFISGKFDQFKKNIPYFAFIEAFDSLIKNILAESDESIQIWKAKFLDVLGSNAVLINEVLPNLEYIIGSLPPSEKLPPAEQEYRFRLVLLDFIYCFTSSDHPLVIFLDDLQWSDLPSLNLIERILTLRRSVGDILIVGAYRNNEVSEMHPLSLSIQQIKKENVNVVEIDLKPLDEDTTIQIVADSFGMSLDQANELGKHVFIKTQGNPFFINRFLQSLYENKLVYLDLQDRWTWDQDKIERLSYTDNVIDLMSRELIALPLQTTEALKFAAVQGNSFNIATLAAAMQIRQKDVFQALQPALNTGYLLSIDLKYRTFSLFNEGINSDFESESENLGISFKFLHDRVQQSAYALIPINERNDIHLKTARILHSRILPEKLNDALFDIVSHYIQCLDLITNPAERISVAKLFLKAGEKAKDSTSYDVAIKYLIAARDFLPTQSWQSDYNLTFDILSQLSESESLNGNHTGAEELFGQLLKYARTNLEKLKIYYIHAALYLKIGNTQKSLSLGRKAMSLYDIHFPEGKWAIQTKASLEVAKYLLLFSTRYKDKEKLYNLPECNDPEIIAINQFLIDIATSAYQVDQNLMVIVVLRIIRHYLKFGFTDASGWGFSGFSVIAYSGIGLSKRGFALWDITRKLHQRTKSSIIKTKLDYTVNAFYNQWKHPLTDNLGDIVDNVKACLMNGDPNFAGYAISLFFWKKLSGGLRLTDSLESTSEYIEYLKDNKIDAGINFISPSIQLARALTGTTDATGEWDGGDFKEIDFLKNIKEIGNQTNVAFYYNFKLPYYYYFLRHEEGLKWADEGDDLQVFILGHYFLSEWYFYYSLLISSQFHTFDLAQKRKYKKILKRNLKWFHHWIKGCPENFQQQLLILQAEESYMAGRIAEAIKLLEQAIVAATKHGFTQFAALANERIAQHLSGVTKQSNYYLKDAYDLYDQWAAFGKCRHMMIARPDLFNERIINQSGSTRTNFSIAALDYSSLIKASHSISSKIKLDELIQRLMSVLLENAGAQRGVLLIPKEAELYIVAEGQAGPDPIQSNISIPLSDSKSVPQTLINYSWRTQEVRAINNALRDEISQKDDYVIDHQIKSMICIPLSNKGNKVGLIYLENKLLEGVFTANKLEVLNMLSGQIGISIDNALLYENLESKVTERTRDLEKQKLIAESQTQVALEQKQLAESERKKSDILLLNILPDEVARELKTKGESEARQFGNVTVIFTDFVNFTTICESLSPIQLVYELNKCFAAFDQIIDKHELEKIKTIGDAYLAVSGLPRIFEDHALKACHAAIDILNWVKNPDNNCLFDIRIGINSGPVIAGIVGLRKYVYDIWGDTVNTASRLESSSASGKINLSESTYQMVKDQLPCEYRGKIQAKNKGSINMYYVKLA